MKLPTVRFAAPGVDTGTFDQGAYKSGAGLPLESPQVQNPNSPPWDWGSNNPLIDHATSNLVGNFDATKTPNASTIRIRRRGITPWGGSFDNYGVGRNAQKSGGIVDTNTGADIRISGGKGQASSFVRVNGPRKSDEGMKLPVLPKQVVRGGVVLTPTGGGIMGTGAPAPIQPKVYGFPSIIKVLINPTSAKG